MPAAAWIPGIPEVGPVHSAVSSARHPRWDVSWDVGTLELPCDEDSQ